MFTKKNKNTEITDETVLISASDATGDDNNNNNNKYNNSNNSKSSSFSSSSSSSSSSESELENAENEEEKKLSPEQREIKAKMLHTFNDYQAFINTEINSMERKKKKELYLCLFICIQERDIQNNKRKKKIYEYIM